MVADDAPRRAGCDAAWRGDIRLDPRGRWQAWYRHRVVALLRDRGYDVVAADLPAGDDAAGLEEHAEVVLDATRSARSPTRPG